MSCKGCSVSVRHTKEEVEKLVEEQLVFETDLVSNEVYESRLNMCQNCANLQYEIICGCFVAFRAKLAYKRCPDPSGPRWDSTR